MAKKNRVQSKKVKKPSLIVLTPDNYFTPYNTAISNSKVSDFLLSKEYYFKKNIERSIQFKRSTPMKIGSIVDAMFSGLEIPYSVSCLKREDPDLFEFQKSLDPDSFVSALVMKEAHDRYESIIKEPFMVEFASMDVRFQVILQGNIFCDTTKRIIPICGALDMLVYDKEKNEYHILDLKCTSKMKCETKEKWSWTMHSMGYFRQLAVYLQLLAGSLKEPPNNIFLHHIVSYKENDSCYKVKLFTIDPKMLQPYWTEFSEAVKQIAAESRWVDDPVTWDKSEVISYVGHQGANDDSGDDSSSEFDGGTEVGN